MLRVQTCGEEGPASLAALWSTPPDDQLTREILSGVSGQVRDRRMFEALMVVVQDATRPTSIRLAAIASLASLSRSPLSVRIYEEGPEGGRVLYAQVGIPSHDVSTQGNQPLPGTARTDILALLDRVGQGDVDPVMRRIASSIAKQLNSLPD